MNAEDGGIEGMSTAYAYAGGKTSAAPWHAEDGYQPSINVNHLGAPKVILKYMKY